jgi:hypothetical protein
MQVVQGPRTEPLEESEPGPPEGEPTSPGGQLMGHRDPPVMVLETVPAADDDDDDDDVRTAGLFDTQVALSDKHKPLRIWQDPMGKITKLLGHSLYPSAIALVEYVTKQLSDGGRRFQQKVILEVGAGLGAPGLAFAKLFGAQVTVTDLPGLVPLLDLNIDANFSADDRNRPTACELTWGDTLAREAGHWDWIIGTDVAYAGKHKELVQTLLMECGNDRHCRVLLALSDRTDPTEGMPMRRFKECAAEFFRITTLWRKEWKFQGTAGIDILELRIDT